MQSIPDVNIDNFSKCVMCVEAKYAEKPFKSVTSKQIELLKLVHSDLVYFKNIASKGEKNDCITFADDCSRYTKVYLLRSKKEVEEMFLKYKVEVKNQSDWKPKRLRTDRGEEYETNSLTTFSEKNGIIHETVQPVLPNKMG